MSEADQQMQATCALFVLASEINGSNRIPLAYMLTNKIDGAAMGSFVKACLKKMDECGATVLTITYDGLASNFAATHALGGQGDPKKGFQPHIIHPTNGSNVYLFPDPIHMMKLMRNAFKHFGFFLDQHNRVRF